MLWKRRLRSWRNERQVPIRLPISALLLLVGACGGEPAVFDAPDFGQAVNKGYQPCDNGQCPIGYLCQQQICIPMRDLGTTGEQTTDDSDATTTTDDGGETTGTGGETTDGEQTTGGVDLGETTDSGGSDTAGGGTGEQTTGGSTGAQTTGAGDTTTGGEGTGQVAGDAGGMDDGMAVGDDGEVLDDCKIPGQAQDCDDPNKTGCRVIAAQKYACSGSLSFQPKGVGCSKHEDCDPSLGCHHNICTSYCEIAAGNAYCTFGSPWPICKSIGDPQWGACSP